MAFRVIARAGSVNMRAIVSCQSPVSSCMARARCRKWMAKSTDRPSVSELRMATGMS